MKLIIYNLFLRHRHMENFFKWKKAKKKNSLYTFRHASFTQSVTQSIRTRHAFSLPLMWKNSMIKLRKPPLNWNIKNSISKKNRKIKLVPHKGLRPLTTLVRNETIKHLSRMVKKLVTEEKEKWRGPYRRQPGDVPTFGE